MTIGSDVGPSRRSKNRQKSGAQGAQWQFQADLLDQLSDAVIAVDLDECITYLNRAAVAQYRVDPVRALGQPLSHAYRYEWLQPEDEFLADAALAQQGHWRGENRHIRRDGSTLHVESQVTILRDGAGNATGLLATIRDITDRKQMERDLRASELRYRRLADTLPQLVWSADVVGVTDYYNIHIHDFDPSVWQGAKGFDWESLLHPDDLAPTLAIWQEAVTQRRPYSCEHRMRMADGSWRWHLSRAVLLQDPDNGLRWYGTATDIHERKTTEEALRTSQRLMQAIVNISPTVIYIHDLITLQNVFVSPQAATTLGYTAAEFAAFGAELMQRLMHPDDQIAIGGHFDRLLTAPDSAVFEFEYRMRHKEGYWSWFLTRDLVFQRTPDGRPAQVLGVAVEITERKAAEEALRASEERYRTLFETMDEGFCVFEMLYNEADEPVDYRFLEVNPSFARFTGLENAVGKTAYELVPNLEAHWVAIYGAVARTGEAHHFIEGSAAMGRWFEIYAFRFGGPESRRVALLFTNITERKMIEDALRAREAQLRQLADAMPQIVWQGDEAGGIVYLNQRWYDYTGLTVEQSLADPTQATHPDDQAMAMRTWQEVRPQGKPYEYELRLRRADGIYRWHLTRCVPVYSPKGQLLCWYGTSTDLHDRQEAEIALRTREEQLRLATKAGGVGIFDHDLITNQTEISPIYAQITGLPLVATMPR